MQQNNMVQDVENVAVGALAAASKTPFRTAFMLTFGMGLARVLLAIMLIAGVMVTYKVIFT